MRTRTRTFLAIAFVAVASLGLYACGGDQVQNVIIEQPAPATPAPSTAPTASPLPGQVGAVDSAGIFAFGYENDGSQTCVAPPDGQRQNAAGQYIVPNGCRLALTATAFDRAGNPIHLPAETPISWSVSGQASLSDRAPTTFNKNYHRLGAGPAFVTVTLAGKTGTRGFENR